MCEGEGKCDRCVQVMYSRSRRKPIREDRYEEEEENQTKAKRPRRVNARGNWRRMNKGLRKHGDPQYPHCVVPVSAEQYHAAMERKQRGVPEELDEVILSHAAERGMDFRPS